MYIMNIACTYCHEELRDITFCQKHHEGYCMYILLVQARYVLFCKVMHDGMLPLLDPFISWVFLK